MNLHFTCFASIVQLKSAITSMKAGAFDIIQKPVAPNALVNTLRKAIKHIQQTDKGFSPRREVTELDRLDNMIGQSSVMQNLFERVIKIAKSNANVLIYGESGTGKELIVRSIHGHSPRADKALIPVDCVALPQNLLESELFGYEKGAFTGADFTHHGLLEYADQGTLFLDEICELDVHLQSKLLRVLQEREFRRVGGKSLIKIDIRIISATNVQPSRAVEDGRFREDLYYRLNVIPIEIPPLRQRREDIPLLVNHYFEHFGKSAKSRKKKLDDGVIKALVDYSWPGNVRELKNLVEFVVSLTVGENVRLADLPEYITSNSGPKKNQYSHIQAPPFLKAKAQVLQGFEKEYFSTLLTKCGGNISKAAQMAGVSRRTMYRMINNYNLYPLIEEASRRPNKE